MSKRLAVSGVLIAALALASCHGKNAAGTAPSAGEGATSAAADPSDCHAFQSGKGAVIRTFCDGPASAIFTVGELNGKFAGGACEHLGQMFSLNAGVVTLPGGSGVAPNYLGLSGANGGDFQRGIFALHYGGKSWGSNEIRGHVDAKGGTFEGPVHSMDSARTPAMVKGSFTC